MHALVVMTNLQVACLPKYSLSIGCAGVHPRNRPLMVAREAYLQN